MRATVREGLVQYASVLEDAETMTRDEFRERVKEVVVELAASGQTGMGFPKEYGGGGDIGASVAAFETLGFGDLSVLVKVGVQFGLFGGAILQLGTKPHHDAYLAGLVTGEILGCFAMTETGHGSNVQALGTTATYDPGTQEFVIQTESAAATKDYIGNAAKHAHLAVVFAQLVVGGEGHGVHALVVPLRDGDTVLPGITITDDGPKMGLNGVDNGRIRFDGVRVPRTSLLDQFAQVTEDGDYLSEIENPNRRFFTMLGTLVQGRVCVGAAGLSASKVALNIAVEYGLPPAPVRGDRIRRGGAAPGATGCTSAALPAARARLRAALRPGDPVQPSCTRCSPARRTTRRPGASSSRERPGPRRSPPGTRRGRSRSAARRAAGPATCRSTGSRRSRPTRTSS